MSYKILVLNPGSTSTKAAVYEDEKQLMVESFSHSNRDLAPYHALNDQLDYRVALVRSWLAQQNFSLSELSAVVGRGGIIPNIVAGGYVVDDNLLDCLRNHTVFDHASNLGGMMADAFARPLGIPAYIYDAVTSDELLPEARVTGFREVTRTSLWAAGMRISIWSLPIWAAVSPFPLTERVGSSTRWRMMQAPSRRTGAAA